VPPDIAVVIVAYNSADVIAGLLDSLPAALEDLTADVVVVDNGSSDGTATLVEARTDCRLVRSPNTGYAGGINRGVREAAPAPAILVLNPDVRLAPDSVPAMRAAMALPGTAIVAPRVVNENGSLNRSLRREPTLSRALGLTRTGLACFSEYVDDEADYGSPRTVDWALGAVLLVSREAHLLLGGWDASYFLYSEEVDLCLRARDLGLATRYEPRARALHIGGASGRNDKTHVMQIINRVRLYARRHRTPAAAAYLGLAFLSELSWSVRGRPESRAAVRALLVPSSRPVELGLGRGFIPR